MLTVFTILSFFSSTFAVDKKVQVKTNGKTHSYDVNYKEGIYSIKLKEKKVEFIDFSKINSILEKDLDGKFTYVSDQENVQSIYTLEQADRNATTYSLSEKEKQSTVLKNKLEWCKNNKSCDESVELLQSKVDTRKEEIDSSRKIGSCLDLNNEEVLNEILWQNKKSASNYRVSYDEYLRLDESYCNAVSGILATHLEMAGLEEGKDYNFSAGPSHVFIELPKQNKIIDPTMAQFFKKGSGAHSYLMMQGGFVGSREELGKYLYANRDSFIYKGQMGKDLKAALETAEPEKNFVGILEKMYFGKNTSNENGLVKVAQEMRDKNLAELANQHKLKYNENYAKMAYFISEQNHLLKCNGPILKSKYVNSCATWKGEDKKTDSFLGNFMAVIGFDPVKKVKN